MLESARAPCTLHGIEPNFQDMFFIHISIFLQKHIKIRQKDRENEAHKDPKIRAIYELQWPANHHCAGITLREANQTGLALESCG